MPKENRKNGSKDAWLAEANASLRALSDRGDVYCDEILQKASARAREYFAGGRGADALLSVLNDAASGSWSERRGTFEEGNFAEAVAKGTKLIAVATGEDCALSEGEVFECLGSSKVGFRKMSEEDKEKQEERNQASTRISAFQLRRYHELLEEDAVLHAGENEKPRKSKRNDSEKHAGKKPRVDKSWEKERPEKSSKKGAPTVVVGKMRRESIAAAKKALEAGPSERARDGRESE